jgi:phosphoribosylaminoimidazolecarboxamide formyltransferase/IMP cyclohydrolase
MSDLAARKQYRESVSADHLPDRLTIGKYSFGSARTPLRYGLTPGDAARAYEEEDYSGPSILSAEVIQEGTKIRSYGNVEDWDTGLSVIGGLSDIYPLDEFVCVMKHAIPFAVARAKSVEEAYELSWNRDPIIPFGGVLALSGVVEEQIAQKIHETFIDGILARGYSQKAIEVLSAKSDLRILALPTIKSGVRDYGYEAKSINGGMLVAERHRLKTRSISNIVVTSQKNPDEEMLKSALFQWIICSFVRSNAATFGDERVTYGVGAGQGSRVDAISVALSISAARCPYYQRWQEKKDYPLVLATDGFPPEPDSIETCHRYGISALMSPRGSIKDQIVLDRANELGMVTLSPESNERPFVHR